MNNLKKIIGLSLHYLFAMKRNPARIIEIFVWPGVEVLIFGLLAASQTERSPDSSHLALQILAGVTYWNCTARTIQESVAQFIDDFVSRNIQNIMIAPISLGQIIFSSIIASTIKLCISLLVLVTILFIIYPSFFSFAGAHAFIWVAQLELFGVALSLFAIGGIFLFGQRASFSGWLISAIIQVFSLVFYDRSALPEPLQSFSRLVPSSYIFETIRSLQHGVSIPRTTNFITLGLITAYLILGAIFISWAYKQSRKIGTLTKL